MVNKYFQSIVGKSYFAMFKYKLTDYFYNLVRLLHWLVPCKKFNSLTCISSELTFHFNSVNSDSWNPVN